MIFQAIGDAFLGLLQALLTPIPNIPPMPSDIVSAGSLALTFVSQGLGLIKYVFGSEFIAAYVGMIIALISFDKVWDLTFFILRKIPMLGVKQ